MSKPIEQLTDEEFEQYMNGAVDEDGNIEDEQEEVEVDTTDAEDEVEETEEDETEDDESEEETDEEDEGDDTEQPESDADAEDSDDDNTDESEEDEADEDSEEDTAASGESEEDPTEESTEAQKEVETPKYKIKANGMDFEFTPEELVALAPKALDYTKKMQQIKPYREMVSAIEDEGINKDDLNMLISIHKGDRDAIAEVIKRNKIDVVDIVPEESNYVPKSYGRNETELAIGDVISEISKDKEYVTTDYIVRNQWDDQSKQAFVKEPELIAALHEDVRSGFYDKYAPLALKKKALDGGKRSDLEYHREAAIELAQKLQAEQMQAKEEPKVDAEAEAKAKMLKEAKAKREKQETIKKTAKKRKAAATTRPGGGKAKVKDYLANDSLSDEEFSKLMEKQIRG